MAFSKQNSDDNGSNGESTNGSNLQQRSPPDRSQPGTSKSFAVNIARTNNSGLRSSSLTKKHSSPVLRNKLLFGKTRCNSDSNLIDKIHNESSLINIPKTSSCENCEKIRTKVKLKISYAIQQLANVKPNDESAIADTKEILNDTLESIDQVNSSYSIQSSSSSSNDSSLSIIPMPESGMAGERNHGSDTTLEVYQEQSTLTADIVDNGNAVNNNENSNIHGTIIEVGRRNSLSPLEPPLLAHSVNLPAKRFFTLDNVKTK